MELGVWGCTESFFFFFADGLKEQPSLMDYFQLRIQISHPFRYCNNRSCSCSPEPFGSQSICPIHILHKGIYFGEGGCDAILNTCVSQH